MTRFITILGLLCVGLSVSGKAVTDCSCYPLTVGHTSPYALFYAKGYDFLPVTASASVSGATTTSIYIGSPTDAIDVSSSSSATITKEFMETHNLGTGVYPIGCYAANDCWATAGWAYYEGGNLFSEFTPVSSSVETKTVHYTYTSTTGTLYASKNYTIFAPNGQSTGGGTLSDSGTIDITFAQRGPYGLAGQGIPEKEPCDPCLLCADLHHVDGRVETPAFEIYGISSSTSSLPQYASAIEPAYGDNVTFHWQKTYNEFHAASIVILQEDPAGTIVDPNDSNKKYSIAATVPLEDSTNVVDHGISNHWQWTGDLTWPAPGTHLPEFPSGNHRLGIKYDDGYVGLTNKYIDVYLSIYDAYTDNHAPLYLGDDAEGKTSIYYTMSAPAQENGVNINIGGVKTIQGTSNKGANVLQDAWDGTTSPDNYVNGGSYGLTFNVTPLSGSVGPLLSIINISHNSIFVPASNETLTIGFDINEPVRRPQATQAKLTAVIYDSDGEFVRLLANEQQVNINNQANYTNGHNELIWDGKNELGETVDPGSYIITLFAEDNAGVGCESGAVTTSITVTEPPQSETVLEWPIELEESENLPDGVPGYTDSFSSVFVSVDGGAETTAINHQNGVFFVNAPTTPGTHTVTLRTNSGQFPEKSITVTYLVNDPSISEPASGSRFDPQANGLISVTYNSQVADSVDVYVFDPFDQSLCIDKQNPVPVAVLMNGTISPKLVRTIETNRAVVAGANTIQWDGKDDSGQFVSPGLYDIVIKRHNADGLLDSEVSIRVVVEHPTNAPIISGITNQVSGSSVSINWNTNVATTGYLVYEVDGNPAGKTRATGTPSTNHTVWLPGTTSATEYDYYIVAVNPTSGTCSISPEQSVTTGNGPQIGTSVTIAESSAEVQISYFADNLVFAAVEYAEVGPGISQVQWHKIEHDFSDEQHVFNLIDLQANAEYAYRIITSTDSNWTNCSRSQFEWFVTKTTLPTVAFNDLVNGQGIESLSQVVVRASSSACARFSPQGITRVQLLVDGQEATSYTKISGFDYVDYTFDLTALQLTNGVHTLDAVAYDDYWQIGSTRIEVLLTGNTGVQSGFVAQDSSTLPTASSPPKIPKKKRHGHSVYQLSLKHAQKTLRAWALASTEPNQRRWAKIADAYVSKLISKGMNLAKSNPDDVNAIAFMLEKLGQYKESDVLPARAARVEMSSGQPKCAVAVGDAFVIGNKHKMYKYGKDWPTKSGSPPNCWPEVAAHLADRSYKLRPRSLTRVSSHGPGIVIAYGWYEKKLFWTTPHGHVGLSVNGDVVISANPGYGIRFGSYKTHYYDVAKVSHYMLSHLRY